MPSENRSSGQVPDVWMYGLPCTFAFWYLFPLVEGLAAYFLVFSHFSVGRTSARVFPVVSITHSQVICLDFMFRNHK